MGMFDSTTMLMKANEQSNNNVTPEKPKHSKFHPSNANQYGQLSYYSHEDHKGEKIEYRNSKIVPLQEAPDEEDEEIESCTTPISSSQMKSEFRDKFEISNKESAYVKLLMKSNDFYHY